MKTVFKLFVLAAIAFCAFLVTVNPGSCDVHENKPSKLGRTFEVVGRVYAYSVASDLNYRRVSFISIVPINLSGPEIIKKTEIPVGTKIKISEIRRRNAFTECEEKLVVELDPDPTLSSVEKVLFLNRGNQGAATEFNTSLYREIPG